MLTSTYSAWSTYMHCYSFHLFWPVLRLRRTFPRVVESTVQDAFLVLVHSRNVDAPYHGLCLPKPRRRPFILLLYELLRKKSSIYADLNGLTLQRPRMYQDERRRLRKLG